MFLMLYSLWYWEGITGFKDSKDRRLNDFANNMANLKFTRPYPVCASRALNFNATRPIWITTLDAVHFAQMAYFENPRQNFTEYVDTFRGEKVCNDSDNFNCPKDHWRWVHHEHHLSTSAVFFHVHHPQSNTEIVAIRGSTQSLDWPQNFAMTGASGALRMMDYVVPISTLIAQG